jgi:hypothetical protein
MVKAKQAGAGCIKGNGDKTHKHFILYGLLFGLLFMFLFFVLSAELLQEDDHGQKDKGVRLSILLEVPVPTYCRVLERICESGVN